MAANKPPAVKITGIRGSIPSGYILGRASVGHGDVELLSVGKAQAAGLIPSTLPGPPTGVAGGDLTGTYPNPTVAQLQGVPVLAGVPSNLAVLLYHTAGATWLPVVLATVAYTGNYTDLSGLPAIHNIPVAGTTGQVLTKNSNTDYDVSWQTPSAGGSGSNAASIQDDGTTVSLAISDGDGLLVLDGAGDPIFMPEVFPLSAIPTPTQPTVQKFLTVGTFTYTPPVGCVRLEVLLKGSGGGSCGLGTSGSGNGGNGADAIFNGIHAAAGQGGSASTGAQAAGGTGGTGTAVDRKAGAAAGSPFMLIWSSTTFVICGGQGGGQGGGPGLTGGVGGAGNPGVANSGGGAGGPLLQNATQAVIATYNFAGSGAEGEEALVVVNNPTGTYSLTVPDGGTAGAAGVAGFAGAKGGSGRVIVREFYS